MLSYILNYDLTIHILTGLGVYILLIYLYECFRSPIQIFCNLVRPLFQPETNKTLAERYGEWAVITGCTDGIGRQYAFEFASRGINIVLISRTESKLVKVANEIEEKYKVKTKWIQADLSLGRSVFPHLKRELQGIPVGILVNNAGRMYDYPQRFEEVNEDLLWEIMNLNMLSLTMLTHFLLIDMKKRGKGIIVNISSGSEAQPLPYTAIYGASKIFVKNFTLALQHELRNRGIDVQLITPMFVRTKMNEYSTTVMSGNVFCPDVETYTRSAVFTLGKSDRTTGYWSHGLQYAVNKMVPEWVRTWGGAKMNLQMRREYDAQQKTQ
ncbi:inactive hydroxysteroid dehydrogenase-like protein 1 [Culicoides brevitarsis]|uniref:inactive hydroxysteroid dehydrogenase-like protein 1 n=1 Tax=Culicoides brevitarsis TaxID=469753 RepID=UPI00307B54FE